MPDSMTKPEAFRVYACSHWVILSKNCSKDGNSRIIPGYDCRFHHRSLDNRMLLFGDARIPTHVRLIQVELREDCEYDVSKTTAKQGKRLMTPGRGWVDLGFPRAWEEAGVDSRDVDHQV